MDESEETHSTSPADEAAEPAPNAEQPPEDDWGDSAGETASGEGVGEGPPIAYVDENPLEVWDEEPPLEREPRNIPLETDGWDESAEKIGFNKRLRKIFCIPIVDKIIYILRPQILGVFLFVTAALLKPFWPWRKFKAYYMIIAFIAWSGGVVFYGVDFFLNKTIRLGCIFVLAITFFLVIYLIVLS